METSAQFDAATTLNDFANTVVLATYTDLDNKAGDTSEPPRERCNSSKTQAKFGTGADSLERQRDDRGNRVKPSYSVPLTRKGLDPALDSWPVNRVDLNAVLASGDALTASSIDGLEDTLKGFHTIEYLLFRDGNQRKAADITPRELEYLVATTENLKAKTAQLRLAWDSTGENFAAEVANAGSSSQIYKSQKSAMQEMVNGMIVIADEVANGKISDPFNERDTTLVESQFSFNSITDFQDNIRGIQNVYLGKFTADGQGLNTFIAGTDATLDSRFQTEVQAAIDAIGAIPDPFRDSIRRVVNRPSGN